MLKSLIREWKGRQTSKCFPFIICSFACRPTGCFLLRFSLRKKHMEPKYLAVKEMHEILLMHNAKKRKRKAKIWRGEISGRGKMPLAFSREKKTFHIYPKIFQCVGRRWFCESTTLLSSWLWWRWIPWEGNPLLSLPSLPLFFRAAKHRLRSREKRSEEDAPPQFPHIEKKGIRQRKIEREGNYA